jgi:cytochrome P450
MHCKLKKCFRFRPMEDIICLSLGFFSSFSLPPQDMLLAGTDTSSNSVEWGIAALLRYPHCLKKLQAELDEVVGKDKTVTESDIPKLPYLNAFMKELFRLYPPAPLGISHECMKDTTLQGYEFVAGTRLYLNIYAIHRDPKWWENPLEFDPERFIKNPDISMKGNYFHFIPFGVGRRQCPGISLAVLFVQLGLARLVQGFELSLPDGQDPTTLDMTAKYGVTMPRKTPLKVICKPRLPKHLYYDTN